MRIDIRTRIAILLGEERQSDDLVDLRNWINIKFDLQCYAIEDMYNYRTGLVRINIYSNMVHANYLNNSMALEIQKRYIETISPEKFAITPDQPLKEKKIVEIVKSLFGQSNSNKPQLSRNITFVLNQIEIEIKDLSSISHEYLMDFLVYAVDADKMRLLLDKYNILTYYFLEYFVRTDNERDELLNSNQFGELKFNLFDLYKKFDVIELIDFETFQKQISIQSIETAERLCGTVSDYMRYY